MRGILGRPEVTVWHSRLTAPWRKVRAAAASPVVAYLQEMAENEAYEDGHGNRYAFEPPQGEPRE